MSTSGHIRLAHQNRTIAIASDFRVDGAKSPEIPQKEGVLGSEIAARNRKSLATFHRSLKSQCSIAFSCLGNRAISGVAMGIAIANRKNRCDFGALSTFDHKGQKSAFRGAVSTGFFSIFSSVFFFSFSRLNLVRKSPQKVEKIARFPGGEKSVESCHVSDCDVLFSGPIKLVWEAL